jgi:16S rRNA (adenine1518-N6/adenine1519-N6)-dimethyltransferase
LSTDKDLIFRAKNYPKQRSLGQNFLVCSKTLDQIVAVSDLNPENDVVIEIGSGAGFLTERLVGNVKQLYSVELDQNALTALEILKANNDNFDYLRRDFLSLNITDIVAPEFLDQKVKIVANIPYQISTKILLHLLGEMAQESPNRKYLSEINILVQKEFAQRLCAEPGCKAYGAITLLVRYWAEVEYCLDVPKNKFMPSPKVDSAFIKIKLRDKPLVDVAQPKQLRRLIKAIFANRRKKLLNGLKAAGYLEAEIAKLDLSENLRGETLTLQEMAEMVKLLT